MCQQITHITRSKPRATLPWSKVEDCTLTNNAHSCSCGCPYTREKAAPLGVVCHRVKRQKKKQNNDKYHTKQTMRIITTVKGRRLCAAGRRRLRELNSKCARAIRSSIYTNAHDIVSHLAIWLPTNRLGIAITNAFNGGHETHTSVNIVFKQS